eukprot:gene25905-biopygen11597
MTIGFLECISGVRMHSNQIGMNEKYSGGDLREIKINFFEEPEPDQFEIGSPARNPQESGERPCRDRSPIPGISVLRPVSNWPGWAFLKFI